jgi:putative transposase
MSSQTLLRTDGSGRLLTTEARRSKGLTRYLVLFFIDLSTRKVAIAGIASHANGLWMSQVGRNATDALDGILTGKRFLIHDRDPLFTAEFQSILKSVGIDCLKLPPRSPNLNAYAERFVRSIKESCLNRLILFGEPSLRRAIREFVTHYHRERNHQGLTNRLIVPNAICKPQDPFAAANGSVACLNYYFRLAALIFTARKRRRLSTSHVPQPVMTRVRPTDYGIY